jgi:DNA-binding response OmpR family regulator
MAEDSTTADSRAARVLIGEPFREVRALLERAVDHLGHEAVPHDRGWRDALPDVDVLVLEPALTDGIELARALRRDNPDLPVICTCAASPGDDVEELDPVAYLVKPYALADLERALDEAVRRATARSRRSD